MLLNRITAPPGLAVAVMAVMVVVRGEMHWSGQESGWSMQCRGPVCETAEKQAEGLARLRVLSDYIKETMNLMESVIASLDDEMVEVAQELKSAVGRRCYSRTLASLGPLMNRQNYSNQQVSENIIEATSSSEATQSSTNMAQSSTSAMSQDVDTVLGSSHSTTQYTSQTPHSSSTTYGNGPDSQRTGGTSHASLTRTSHTTASHKTSRRPDVSDKYEAQPSTITTTTNTAPEDVSRWRGGSGRWQGGGHGHGGSRGQGIGRGQGGDRGREYGGGRGRAWGNGRGNQNRAYEEPPPVQPQGSGCRGVPAGSPHYIPGLDSWCKTNCPLGNCPPTHCIC